MNSVSLSRKFALALMALGFCAMLATAGLHMYAVYAMPKAGSTPPEMMPAPAAQRDQTGAPESSLSQEQMAEVSELMAKLKENPNDSATLVALGDVFLQAGDWTRAEFFLSRAVLSKPGDARPRYMLGIALHQQNKIGQAVKTFEELLAIEDDPSAMYNLGVIYKYQAQDPKRAEELFKKILTLPGVSPEVLEKAQGELK